MKAALRLLFRWCFGFRAFNRGVFRTPGPVILLPNHVSWFDWLFVLACSEGDWKCVVSRRTAQTSWLHRLIMLNRCTFPIDTDSAYGLKHMAEYLRGGGRLVLFPEGRLSSTGTLMRLFEGAGFLLHKTGAQVVTCYLRGAEVLPFSPNPNAKRWFPRVSVHFSEVLTPPRLSGVSALKARAAYTQWLDERIVAQRFEVEMELGARDLVEAFTEAARTHSRRVAVEDSEGRLTFGRLLLNAQLLAQELHRVLPVRSRRVAVLLPNANAVPVVLFALWSLGKQAALLNYSAGPAAMLSCVQLAGARQIVTSRAFLERAKLDVAGMRAAGCEFRYLEDLSEGILPLSKLRAFARQALLPGLRIRRRPRSSARRGASETALVLFTSGSEGVPKGVALTHRNILANVRQMLAVTDLHERDRVFNAMPLFHSFGLTVGLLLPLLRGLSVYLYPSPLHYRAVPTALYYADATIFISTNTFLNGYARRAHPYDFRSLRMLFAAAEKLQESTARSWAERFGVRILEGYGATECSPCVSLNTPMRSRAGSAGRLMPGMEYRLEKVEGVTEGGRLWLRGPNVMKGYLRAEGSGRGEDTDWYDTGDIVRVDADGFVFILGRAKRFAKISGEMVSLTAVEDALAGAFPQFGFRFQTALITRADTAKGEVLVLVSNEPRLGMEDVRRVIRERNLPNIAIPRELRVVQEIPKLGTGKVNYRELEKILR